MLILASFFGLNFLGGGLYRTEVAFALLTKQPRAQIPALLNFFSILLGLWTVESSNPFSACARDVANAVSAKGLSYVLNMIKIFTKQSTGFEFGLMGLNLPLRTARPRPIDTGYLLTSLGYNGWLQNTVVKVVADPRDPFYGFCNAYFWDLRLQVEQVLHNQLSRSRTYKSHHQGISTNLFIAYPGLGLSGRLKFRR